MSEKRPGTRQPRVFGDARTQGVTDTRPVIDYTTDSRNDDNGSVEELRNTGATNNIHKADPLEDVAAKIRALARFPVSGAEMDRVRQARRAQKNCNLCGKCGRELSRGETVWRVYIGGLGHGIVGTHSPLPTPRGVGSGEWGVGSRAPQPLTCHANRSTFFEWR